MTSNGDYSVHYKRFHDDSESHALEMAQWLRDYLKNDLPADRSAAFLDLGCGFGFALRALQLEGFTNVVGLEMSEEQAKIARQNGSEVTVVSDTSAFLKEHWQSWDAVLLLDVLEHIRPDDHIAFLSLLQESLLPGGRLIITVPNANNPLAARWRYIDHTHHCSFTEHSLHYVLKNAGFTTIQMDNTKNVGPFPKKWWQAQQRSAIRRWIVRFAWLQVCRAELPAGEDLGELCFERNLKAVAIKGSAERANNVNAPEKV